MIELPPRLLDPLGDLLACVCQEVTKNGPLCFCGMVPGRVAAWDHCLPCGDTDDGPCGMAWIAIIGMTAYETFPFPAFDVRCTLPLMLQVEVGALRCVPGLGDQGELPGVADQEEATLMGLGDMWALYSALQCCSTKDKAIGPYVAVGPEGGCAGGAFTAWLALD